MPKTKLQIVVAFHSLNTCLYIRPICFLGLLSYINPKVLTLQNLQHNLMKDRRARKFYHCLIRIKERSVRKSGRFVRWRIYLDGILQTVLGNNTPILRFIPKRDKESSFLLLNARTIDCRISNSKSRALLRTCFDFIGRKTKKALSGLIQ